MSLASVVDLLTRPALVLLCVALTVLGVAHLIRVLARMGNANCQCAGVRPLMLADRRLAVSWVVGASTMTVLALVGLPTGVIAASGAVAAFTLSCAATVHGVLTSEAEQDAGLPGGTAAVTATPSARRWMSRVRRVPAFSRVREPSGPQDSPTGERLISPYLNRTIVLTVTVGLLYTGVGAANFLRSELEDPRSDGQSAGTDGDKAVQPSPSPGLPVPPQPPATYAELCPDLPDPLTIGHGLGELFQRHGAVQAGCGHQARRGGLDGSVWMAEGRCGSALRSVGIAAPGRDPLLLYGAAARFAAAMGNDGRLLYAEAAEPAGGDLYVVTTTAGSYVFARPTSSVRAGDEEAFRCDDVDAVAREFAILPPPLAGLWLDHIQRTDGWSWPLPNSTDPGWPFAFVDLLGHEIAAAARCDDESRCELRSADGQRWSGAGSRIVTLDDLGPWMPADSPGSGAEPGQ